MGYQTYGPILIYAPNPNTRGYSSITLIWGERIPDQGENLRVGNIEGYRQ